MLLDSACKWLGWPDQQLILDPKGEGAAACANLVKQKIGDPLRRLNSNLVVNTGILTPDPFGGGTASPLAIICEFPNGANPQALDEAHRLAWCFSRSAILVTLEPHQLMAWSCYQDPNQPETAKRVETLSEADSSRQRQIRELLHWVSLVTGDYHRRRPKAFPAEGRADRLLLKNLRHVRKSLIEANLDRDVCHDLLARVIFTQFLFHRKDNAGNPYFSKTLLAKRCDGTLKSVHDEFGTILQDKEETYALFRWLDNRFNGDLFPGKENQTEADREAAWLAEKNSVRPEHLKMLAELVSGTIDTRDRQLLLWPQYSFDTVPLEFISSVYEEFLNEDRDNKKAYYTPSHLVDYVLDAVLPWDGEEWDLKVLDPSCGSGIFLVKAFQRLVHRWKRHHQRDPLVSDLKPILANNLLGVDKDRDAVRVACFSLYLAMADAIDPKHYVTREKVFPRLRGTRLISADFFDDSTPGIRTIEDAASFDLVIGNAPWGDSTTKTTSDILQQDPIKRARKKKTEELLTKAERWAAENKWPIANNDIGPLFVAKGLQLIATTGRLAMIQPASAWLYQRAGEAVAMRKKLFSSYTVDEVTNLIAVRRELFPEAISPSCVIVVGLGEPDPITPLYYFTPKPRRIADSSTELCIEPHDVSHVSHADAANDPVVWSALALGGQRDLSLVRRLQKHSTLAKLKDSDQVQTRLGFIPGDRSVVIEGFRGKPYLSSRQFPEGTFLELDASVVPAWGDPRVNYVYSDSADSYPEFQNPQLLIKHSYSTQVGRFRAALVRSNDPGMGVICKKTYLSVRDLSPDHESIAAACLVYNSLLATYFLSLTSSRFPFYNTEVNSRELVDVPLPLDCPDLSSITSYEQIDEVIRNLFALTIADWSLVEDLLQFALPDAIRKTPGPGRESTTPNQLRRDEAVMSAYGRTLTRVLKSTFGPDKPVAVTVYQEPQAEKLPVRMVTLHLDWADRQPLTIEPITEDGLLDKLAEFHRSVLSQKTRSVMGHGVGFQRVAYFFQTQQVNKVRVRNLTIIKPDECRYWTRSQAMRDADELAVAIMKAAQRERTKR